ncbi:carboxymuconolactone decarboxylase family protein [Rhodovibrionaceae bacterium A322]
MSATPPALSPLPVEDWDPLLDQVSADMGGKPINVHKLMAHNPQLLQAWWNFRNYSVNGGALGNRLGELVILRVGVSLGAWYEWSSHVDRSLRCGLSLGEINRVLERKIGPDWSAQEACLLQAVDELRADQKLSDAIRISLSEHFTVPQILDIIAIHGMYVILGCMIKTWGLELDDSVKARIDDHTKEDDFDKAAAAFRAAAEQARS